MRKIKHFRPNTKVLGEFGEMQFMVKASSLGLAVAKPYGDSLPYDFIVDTGHRLLRIQVKCASACSQSPTFLVSTVRGRKNIGYDKKQIDFLVAWIVPEDAWYVIPVSVIRKRRQLWFFPTVHGSRAKFERYREAWHLLMPEKSLRRIFAQADNGAWDHVNALIYEMANAAAMDAGA